MNTFDRQHDNLREEQLDSLLRDFFMAEMPVEVCELTDPPVSHRAPEIVHPSHTTAGRMPTRVVRVAGTVSAIAAVLLLAWSITDVREANRPEGLASKSTPAAPQSSAGRVSHGTSAVTESANVVEVVAESHPHALAKYSLPSRAIHYEQTEEVASIGEQKYATRQGPVEQRTQRRTTNVSFYEPRSGSQVRLQVPEIEIEILVANDEGT